MYITVDDIQNEISFYYPFGNRNGNRKVGLIALTSFSVSIMLKKMKRSTLALFKLGFFWLSMTGGWTAPPSRKQCYS